jgi:hypothetical protein
MKLNIKGEIKVQAKDHFKDNSNVTKTKKNHLTKTQQNLLMTNDSTLHYEILLTYKV